MSLDEGEVEILKYFMDNPAPKTMQHAHYINNSAGVSGPFGRGKAE